MVPHCTVEDMLAMPQPVSMQAPSPQFIAYRAYHNLQDTVEPLGGSASEVLDFRREWCELQPAAGTTSRHGSSRRDGILLVELLQRQ